MNAGEITIRVRAELAEFDGQMREVERKAAEAGEGIGTAMTEKVGAFARFGDAIGKKFTGPMAFIGLAENVAESINVASEKGIGAGLESLVQSTPLIGTAYRLGSAIGNAVMTAFDEETDIGGMLNAQLSNDQLAAQLAQSSDLQKQLDVEAAKAAGDERLVATLEAEAKIEQIRKQREQAFLNAVSDQEMATIEENAARAEELEMMRLDARYAEIQRREDEKAQREIDAAERVAQKKAQDEQRLAEKAEQDAIRLAEKEADLAEKERDREIKFTEDSLDAIGKEMTAIEEERRKSETAGVGEFQTALGSFKFDAYPASEKRQNDQKMVKYLEDLARRGLQLSEQRSSLGFT